MTVAVIDREPGERLLPGAPITATQQRQVIHLASSTHLSAREIGKAIGISHQTVSRYIKTLGLRPPRTTDPRRGTARRPNFVAACPWPGCGRGVVQNDFFCRTKSCRQARAATREADAPDPHRAALLQKYDEEQRQKYLARLPVIADYNRRRRASQRPQRLCRQCGVEILTRRTARGAVRYRFCSDDCRTFFFNQVAKVERVRAKERSERAALTHARMYEEALNGLAGELQELVEEQIKDGRRWSIGNPGMVYLDAPRFADTNRGRWDQVGDALSPLSSVRWLDPTFDRVVNRLRHEEWDFYSEGEVFP